MQLDFLTPPIERLRSDGAFEVLHAGGALGRLRRPVVLLARDLCTFALFETAALPTSRRRPAARVYAKAASPYVAGGAALIKCADDFGVWWWDLERILPMVSPRFGTVRPALRPETLAQPMGRDWRIVRLSDGYEAQLWKGRGLVASVWRRTSFDPATWNAFTRLQRSGPPAPDTPPPAQSLPIASDSEAFSLSAADVSREQAMAMAATGFALVVAMTMAFLLGQGLVLSREATAMQEEAVLIRQTTARIATTDVTDSDRRQLIDYRQIEERTNPVTAAGAAIGILTLYDEAPTAIEVDEDIVRLTLPYSAVEQADDLVAEFEQSGYFHDVRPRTDTTNGSLVFEMSIRGAAPPLTPDA